MFLVRLGSRGVGAPTLPAGLGVLGVPPGPKMKSEAWVFFSIDCFVLVCHEDSPYYPLMVNNAG